jgi:TatD DNase family protein
MWCDSHCHLQYEDVPADAIDRARAAGVARMVCIGTDAEQSAAAIAIARAHPESVCATVGLHPHDAKHQVDGILPLLSAPEVVAVGECGLDYHYDHSPRPVQREVFAAQIDLAAERGLALVVHTREAWEDTFDILRAGPSVPTVFHCFSGGPEEARRALDLGAWLSFSGIVTFKTAGDVRAAAALAPLDRILVETDSPYLTPVPHRGRPNEPSYVPLVGAAVAAGRGVPVVEIEDATWANARDVFGDYHSE